MQLKHILALVTVASESRYIPTRLNLPLDSVGGRSLRRGSCISRWFNHSPGSSFILIFVLANLWSRMEGNGEPTRQATLTTEVVWTPVMAVQLAACMETLVQLVAWTAAIEEVRLPRMVALELTQETLLVVRFCTMSYLLKADSQFLHRYVIFQEIACHNRCICRHRGS
jgi:hypothetical protein